MHGKVSQTRYIIFERACRGSGSDCAIAMSKQLTRETVPTDPLQLPLYSDDTFRSRKTHGCLWRNLIVVSLLVLYVYVKGYQDCLSYLSKPSDRAGVSYLRRRTPSYTQNPAYIVEAANGAVASENVMCSEMGVDTLKAGGNAVDAIVSTTLCIGVVSMYS